MPGLLFCLFLLCGGSAFAGTTGILEGVVRDKATHELIPGVNVTISQLQRGAATDIDGAFQIPNIAAGHYEVRFSHIGHRAYTLKNVAIQPDLRTRLTVDLEPTDVELPEVTVVLEKPLIQTDVTGSTFQVTDFELNALPVDNVTDILHLKPGVTMEGNVRGGRTDEVLYLIDGLPVKDVLAGEMSVNLPKSSIAGMSITTGGFEPEYGNALSGVVNVVTKSGTNESHYLVKADKDNLFGGQQNSNTNDFDLSASGAIVNNALFYYASGSGTLTDTRWRQDFKNFFRSPIEKDFSGFGKVEYLFSPTTRLGTQVLYSHKDWRDYQFDWRFNLDGLPPEKRDSYRIALVLTQNVSDNFFYTASLSRYFLRSRIGEGSKEDIPSNQPYQYDFFLRYIVTGKEAWWSDTKQVSYTTKFDGTYHPAKDHLVKFGGELSLYDLHSDVVKYEPKRTYFGRPLINEPQLDYSTSYAYRPQSGSLYIQDKIDALSDGALLNVGLRYDFLNPTANRPAIEAIPASDTAYSFVSNQTVPAKWKHQISPRLGASMQVAENGYLFMNMGWYFQYPLFDYLYTGLDRAALARGLSALTGNPDLEPERTLAYELSIRYSFPGNLVASITYFSKQTTNLIDTKTFVPGDSKLVGTYGFAEYVNTPNADAHGFELTFSRERGNWFTGEISYTFMITEGTSGSAQDGFYIAQYGLPPATRTFPLSWDQTHTIKLTGTFIAPFGLTAMGVAEYHSGRPYTNYPTATGFEAVDGGLFSENNARMPSYMNLDIRAEQSFTLGFLPNGRPKVFVDIRNVLNRRNVKWMDSNGRIGGELNDPSGYYIGRRTHVGIQIDF